MSMYSPAVWEVPNPQFAPISISGSGDNTIVAAVGGKQIRVVKASLVCAAPVVVTWKSSAAGAISGPMSFAANGGISEPQTSAGIIQTAVGEALVINLGTSVSVGGALTYILV